MLKNATFGHVGMHVSHKIGNKYTGELEKKMEKYLEMQAKIDDIRREAVAILDKVESEERYLSKAEDKKLVALKEEKQKIERTRDRHVVEAGIEAEIATDNDPIKPWPGDYDSPRGMSSGNDRSYRGLFHNGDKGVSLSKGNFENFEEFLQVVSTGRYDPRLMGVSTQATQIVTSSRSMIEGDDSLGGFMVPEQFGAFLMDAALEKEIVRSRAKIWPMKSDTLKVPGWSGFDHSSGVYGGFSGVWLAEGGTATPQDATLRQIKLIAKKLGIYNQASRELIQDGIGYEAQLKDALTSALAFYLDDAFFNGDGVGKPLGLLSDPALVTVAKETEQANDTVVYENIIKMMARLHPSAFKNAIWVANQTALPQFMTMYLAIGDAGTAVKAVEERGGKYTLLGKELVFTEKLPVLGDKGDVMLVDLSKYIIGMRQELVFDKSNAPGWKEDMMDFRTILRCDGQGSWESAVTPKNGDSLSWCVTLATRGA